LEGGSGIGGSGETVVTVDVVALGVCLSGKKFGMGNLKVVHDTVFAMGRRVDFDFEVVTKTAVKNDYESETYIDYCCIVIDDLEQLKLLIKAIREDIIIEYTDEREGYDLVLKIYDDYLE
jgi:hypothetical protein